MIFKLHEYPLPFRRLNPLIGIVQPLGKRPYKHFFEPLGVEFPVENSTIVKIGDWAVAQVVRVIDEHGFFAVQFVLSRQIKDDDVCLFLSFQRMCLKENVEQENRQRIFIRSKYYY